MKGSKAELKEYVDLQTSLAGKVRAAESAERVDEVVKEYAQLAASFKERVVDDRKHILRVLDAVEKSRREGKEGEVEVEVAARQALDEQVRACDRVILSLINEARACLDTINVVQGEEKES